MTLQKFNDRVLEYGQQNRFYWQLIKAGVPDNPFRAEIGGYKTSAQIAAIGECLNIGAELPRHLSPLRERLTQSGLASDLVAAYVVDVEALRLLTKRSATRPLVDPHRISDPVLECLRNELAERTLPLTFSDELDRAAEYAVAAQDYALPIPTAAAEQVAEIVFGHRNLELDFSR